MAKHKTAIVIDDDAAVAEYIARVLSSNGVQAALCFTIEDALAMQTQPDFIFADIFMGGIGGIEGIRLLRQKHPDCKIVAMSGGWGDTSGKTATRAALRIGAHLGLAKPFGKDQILGALDTVT